MTKFDYENFTSRNYLYISDTCQDAIKSCRLAFFGTGLSSNLAEQAARLGFEHMSFHDGDAVELSNLNRQAFCYQDIGLPKVTALKNRILNINPQIQVHTDTSYIRNIEDVREKIETSDIVINTVDCNRIYFDIIEHGRKANKLVLCPFNPGFSGLLLCFTQNSCSSTELFDITAGINDVEVARQLFARYPEIKAVRQSSTNEEDFLESAAKMYFPQIAIGAMITTSITLTTIVKYLKNEALPLAPSVLHMDGY